MWIDKLLDRRRRWKQSSAYADVEVELTQMTFRGLLPTVLLGTTGMVSMTVVLAKHCGDPNVWRVALRMATICVLRIACVIAFDRRQGPELTLRSAFRWRRLYGSITFLYCLSLAYVTFYAGQHLDQTARVFTTIGTFTICAGIGSRVGMRPWISNACCMTMLLAVCLSFLSGGGLLGWSSCVMISAFAFSHYISTRIKFNILVEQIRTRHKLRELSERDMLTGLSNRRYFETSLNTAFSQQTPIAVLFIDLDGFKAVNDSFGHAAGDTLLQQVAQRLSTSARQSDLVARLGGDEFAILHTGLATEASARSLAQRVTLAIGLPFSVAGQAIRIGASVGVRVSSVRDLNADKFLGDADEALYRVKQAGGGAVSFAGAKA